MKTLLCSVLLMSACVPVFAQDGEAEKVDPSMGAAAVARTYEMRAEAARLLGSGANSERAWGAYLAGLYGVKGLTPSVVAVLTDASLGAGYEETLVRQAALDALIRLDAKVPAEVLRALAPDFFDETLILLASEPRQNSAALLETFAGLDGEGRAGPRWLAVGNLLAETKAHGFAAQLLGGLKVEATVVVIEREGDGDIGFGGGGGCGGGDGYSLAGGFPPVGYYALTTDARRGAVVVAPGKRPVFYVRSNHFGDAYPDFGEPDRDTVRVEYLAELLNTYEDDLKLDARAFHTVVCREVRQCRRELVKIRRGIEESYAALVARLAENGHLDGAADAPASPDITFNLYDLRRTKAEPLPADIEGVKVTVELMNPRTEEEAEEQ